MTSRITSDEGASRQTPGPRSGWWIQAAQVRLRFLIIFLIVGGIVSQWQLLRGVWDRWVWSITRSREQGSVTSNREYFCPMDPGVVTIWPAICPICNMDLVPRNKMDAVLLPEGVLARMQFSPYRIQLAGIKTALVASKPLNYEWNITGVLKSLENGGAGLETTVGLSDGLLLQRENPAEIKARGLPECFAATARLIEGSFPPRVRVALDDNQVLPLGCIIEASVKVPLANQEEMTSIPASAVVDRGRERLVYVETMPGMFDAVLVELGRRCGDDYPVFKGLKPGQRIALAGAFLIDAETRLNPNLSAGYFGASPSESKPTAPPAATPVRSVGPQARSTVPKKPAVQLSPEDQKLIDKQRICPVTELPLDSMGAPVPVTVAGRKVFICCAGCEKRLKEDPDKYLSRIASD